MGCLAFLERAQSQKVAVLRIIVREYPPSRAFRLLLLMQPLHIQVPLVRKPIKVKVFANFSRSARQGKDFSRYRKPQLHILLYSKPDTSLRTISRLSVVFDSVNVHTMQFCHSCANPRAGFRVAQVGSC